jgi:hypothetical protein
MCRPIASTWNEPFSWFRLSCIRRCRGTYSRQHHATHHFAEDLMYLVREIMYCKPGKVKPMVKKFLKMNELGVKGGMPKMQILTDYVAEQYWTVIAQMEVRDLKEWENMMSEEGMKNMSPEDVKEMEDVMKDYHDLVLSGKREIYRIEG